MVATRPDASVGGRVSPSQRRKVVSAAKERWMRRAGRILRRSLGTLTVFFLFGAAAAAARQVLTTSESFSVARVEFVSGERTPAADFKGVASDALGKNLFTLSLERLQSKVLEHPWAREVVLYRVLPNRLRIVIKEPMPTALVERGDTRIWVDDEGNLIEPAAMDEIERGVDVPLLVGCSAGETQESRMRLGAAALDALRRSSFEFYLRIASLDVSRDDRFTAHLKDYGGSLWLHCEDVMRNVAHLEAVWESLSKRHPAPAYVDLRWRDQIVVMPGGAQAEDTESFEEM